MKRFALLCAVVCVLAVSSFAQPAQCNITETLYKPAGASGSAPCTSCTLTVLKTVIGSTVVSTSPYTITSNASTGAVSFYVPRGSLVTIRGNFVIASATGGIYDFSQGIELYVPNQASATLGALQKSADALLALVTSSAYAPPDSKYIIQTADSDLPNAQVLGSLATGIVKNTTTTGVLSIATAGTDYQAPISTASSSRITFSSNTVDLATSGVTAGSCTACDLTIDAYGRVTAKANGTGGGAGTWGSITGTLSSQTDLQSALDAKSSTSHTHTFSSLTSKPTTLSGYGITDAQGLNSDLTAIAGLSPTNDDILQRKAGAWTNRTIAQLKTDLSLSGSNTGDQTISLTGDVTGSGTGSFATTLANLPTGVPMAGSLLATNIAAPSTPATGKTSIYVDSTSKNFAAKNDAGTVNHGVQTRTASANNWIRAIADDGSTTISQPAFTDISGSVAASQMPALTGDVTTSAGAVATTIGSNKVTNAMLATVSTATFKGRTTAGTGNVEDLTATQATALLNAVVGDSGSGGTKGLVPAPASGDAAAGKFLKADGTFAVPTASVSFANPSASVGLTAVNGSASTAMRSDAAPALDVTIAPTWSGAHTFANTISLSSTTAANNKITQGAAINIGTTSTDGIILQNTTAAAVGAQQYSPRLRLTGQGWKTNSTAASQTVDWAIETQPVQGSANPTGNLAFLTQVNGGGYTSRVNFGSADGAGIINYTATSSTSTPHITINGTTNLGIAMSSAGGSVSLISAGYEMLRINANGLGLGRNGGSGATDVILVPIAAASLRMGAADASSATAQTLSVQNVVAGTSNTAGATWTHQASLGTSQGAPGRHSFTAGALITASGTTQQTAVSRLELGATKVLTNNTNTAIVNVTDASNTAAAGTVDYAIEVFDGTDLQVESGSFTYQVTNKGGTIANNTVTFPTGFPKNVTTSGTLTATWTITAANPAVLTLNANSSLTPSTGYPRVTYSIRNLTQQAIAVQ